MIPEKHLHQDDWLNLLAGQVVPDADPHTVREVQILRAALLSYSEILKSMESAPDPILAKVMSRLQAEEIFKPVSPPPAKRFRFKDWLSGLFVNPWNKSPVWAFATMVMLIVVLVIPWVYHPISSLPPPLQAKGGVNCSINEFPSRQPEADVVKLQRELKMFGLNATVTTPVPNEEWRLEVMLPAEKDRPVELTAWLKHYDFLIPPAAENQLCVKIINKQI